VLAAGSLDFGFGGGDIDGSGHFGSSIKREL
jgi:hypothetical protein